MNALLGRILMVGAVCAVCAVAACSKSNTEAATPVVDEVAYKQQFSNQFNQSCYDGFTRNFENREPPASAQEYRGAKEICECISYNLVLNNNAAQLQALSVQTPEQVLSITRPLVQSCSTQIKQKLAVEYATPASTVQP